MWSTLGRFGVTPRRCGIGCATFAGASVVVGVAVLAWAWALASTEECAEVPREDLTLGEMGSLKQLLRAYKSDPSQPMDLSAREASFILREEFELLAWFATKDDAIEGRARLDKLGRCWNVTFEGTVEVTEGRATVIPAELRIGELPLGWLVRGHAFDLGPAAVDVQPRASEVLQHLDSVHVHDDRVEVRVDDPTWIR